MDPNIWNSMTQHLPNPLMNSFRVDMSEFDTHYLVKVDIPGVPKERIQLSYNNQSDTLIVKANTDNSIEFNNQETNQVHILERVVTQNTRYIRFEKGTVRHDDITATCVDGVLTVHLPKYTPEEIQQQINENLIVIQ